MSWTLQICNLTEAPGPLHSFRLTCLHIENLHTLSKSSSFICSNNLFSLPLHCLVTSTCSTSVSFISKYQAGHAFSLGDLRSNFESVVCSQWLRHRREPERVHWVSWIRGCEVSRQLGWPRASTAQRQRLEMRSTCGLTPS